MKWPPFYFGNFPLFCLWWIGMECHSDLMISTAMIMRTSSHWMLWHQSCLPNAACNDFTLALTWPWMCCSVFHSADSLMRDMSNHAMETVKDLVHRQNLERKKFIEFVKINMAAEISVTNDWKCIIDQLTHERLAVVLSCHVRELAELFSQSEVLVGCSN